MINLIITLYSVLNGIDQRLAFQVAKIESNMNPNAISKTDDLGLFQLNSKYYKFHNENWAFNYQTNTALAMSALKNLKTKCHHKYDNSFMLCYNRGIRGAAKIKNPNNFKYIKKLNILWSL
jgi:soluble lytic murein transglycosylase-like protein